MPDRINIRELTDKQDAVLEEVKVLFQEMYSYMETHGLMLGLASEGAEKWLNGITKGLGRFGVLYLASSNGKLIGFAHGAIRLIPDYLGNLKTGVITHVFVSKEYQAQGTGEELVHELEQWFKEQKVHSVELQVLADNHPAIGFWKKLGYQPELLQCRKMFDQS